MKEKDIKKIFGRNVRFVRDMKRISQESLAFETGTSASYLSRVETGKSNIGVEMLYKIAQALSIDVGLLFQENLEKETLAKL